MQRHFGCNYRNGECQSKCKHHTKRTYHVLRRRNPLVECLSGQHVFVVERGNNTKPFGEFERFLHRNRYERSGMFGNVFGSKRYRKCFANGKCRSEPNQL